MILRENRNMLNKSNVDPGETNRQSVDISAYAMIILEGGTADSRLFGKQTAQKAEKDKICPKEDFVSYK